MAYKKSAVSSVTYGFALDFTSSSLSSSKEHHSKYVEDRDTLLQRTRQEREQRQLVQRRERSACIIQHAIRRKLAQSRVQEQLRAKFDLLWTEYCIALQTEFVATKDNACSHRLAHMSNLLHHFYHSAKDTQ